MTSRLQSGYFTWLFNLTKRPSTRISNHPYRCLFDQMHDTPFRWSVHNDDNRMEDGKDLRLEYLRERGIRTSTVDVVWLEADASMLEVLITLSRMAAFESYSTPDQWLRVFIENLGLQHYTDQVYNAEIEHEVNEALERVITRAYHRNGQGGIFPLRRPRGDQRRIELWYQLSQYLVEGETVANGP